MSYVEVSNINQNWRDYHGGYNQITEDALNGEDEVRR